MKPGKPDHEFNDEVRITLRLPASLHQLLLAAVRKNGGKSLNAEIVSRLKESAVYEYRELPELLEMASSLIKRSANIAHFARSRENDLLNEVKNLPKGQDLFRRYAERSVTENHPELFPPTQKAPED